MSVLQKPRYNFSEIQDRVTAARHLQDAGQDEQAKVVLECLAKEILE